MRKALIAALLLCGALTTFAASAQWTENFQTAVASSKQQKKPILMLFTGSDWCKFCIMMEKDAFGKPEFEQFLSKNFILFKADFPRGKKLQPGIVQQNNALARKYNVEGFPTVLIVSADGKVLAQTGYLRNSGIKEYTRHYEDILKKLKK